jgi:hypothetical protein
MMMHLVRVPIGPQAPQRTRHAGPADGGLAPSVQRHPAVQPPDGAELHGLPCRRTVPELTPYGRLFKMTGYTLGERTVPVSAMVLGSLSKVANTSKSDDPAADFAKNDRLIAATASLFVGGKITDNLGAFAQITHDPYAAQSDNGSSMAAPRRTTWTCAGPIASSTSTAT